MNVAAVDEDRPIPRIVVLGGGVAGLAAAVRLHDDFNAHVTLIEARNRLGGRATSFDDPRTGRVIDNCQHILMRCCTNLVDFYHRLGVIDRIRWHTRLHFAWGSGRIEPFERTTALPAPLHLAPALLRLSAFSFGEKLAIARAMRAMICVRREDVRRHTFETWLRAQSQSPEIIRRYWDVIITSACNLRAARVGAAYAIQVFQEGFLNHADAYVMGVPDCPLRELYDPAAERIDDLRLNTRVRRVHANADGASSIEFADGSTFNQFDAVICALPFEALADTFDEGLGRHDSRFRTPRALDTSPILGVHLWFDQPVTDFPHVAFLDREVQWIFVGDGGRYIHAVISAADAWMHLDRELVVKRVLDDLRPFFAGATAARLRDARIIKERRATFAATPESHDARPACRGSIANLFLAGDYTQTGWPATMEGACRSGYLAAFEAMQWSTPPNARSFSGKGSSRLVSDLEVAPLVRLMRAIPMI